MATSSPSAHGTLFKGTMLIAGTTIGGGMLAAPILMGSSGFIPSLFVYLLCWLVMASTGLLLLEACLWMKRETNLITLATKTLGPCGQAAAWALYLFLFYCLTLSYVVGGGELVSGVMPVSPWIGSWLFVGLFGGAVFFGARLVGILNLPLMLGLAVTYCAFVYFGYEYIQWDLLTKRDWSQMIRAFPIAFAAFGFQGTVPTLITYLDHDGKRARKAILYGTFIPLLVYVIWQMLILGIVPAEGAGGLKEAQAHGYLAVKPLKEILQRPSVLAIGEFFAFFALTTSFLGVTLGLLDFLADGLKVKKTSGGRLFLCILIFIPPLLFSRFFPGIFLQALDVAGGIGVACLLGLMPILMSWVGRYKLKLEGDQMVPGGPLVLLLLLIVVGLEILTELFHLFQ